MSLIRYFSLKFTATSSVSSTPDLGLSDIDDYSTLDDLTVGPLSTGEVKPFSSVKLQVQWQPTVPGQVESEFVVSFTDPMSDTVSTISNDTLDYISYHAYTIVM